MSARPRRGAEEPERGGDGRRLRWSESPIPRVATRRVRFVGAEPIDPGPVSEGAFPVSPGITIGFMPPPDDVYMTGIASPPDPGYLVLSIVSGYGLAPFTPPAGWTVMYDDTVGDVDLLIAWVRGDGSTSGLFEMGGYVSGSASSILAFVFVDVDEVYTPHMGSVTTAIGAASQAMAMPDTGWLRPFNACIMQFDGGTPTYPYFTLTESGPGVARGNLTLAGSGPRHYAFYGYNGDAAVLPADTTISCVGSSATATFLTFGMGFTK